MSIGIELISKPSILFMDEPTTGLDSTTAENIIKLAREVTNSGITTICTLH